jgi:hypothetical protein
MKLELVLATDYEEFYYEDTGEVVPEGEPIGVDCMGDEKMNLYLLNNIYHQFKYEEE